MTTRFNPWPPTWEDDETRDPLGDEGEFYQYPHRMLVTHYQRTILDEYGDTGYVTRNIVSWAVRCECGFYQSGLSREEARMFVNEHQRQGSDKGIPL